jgi:hypothetical protein
LTLWPMDEDPPGLRPRLTLVPEERGALPAEVCVYVWPVLDAGV